MRQDSSQPDGTSHTKLLEYWLFFLLEVLTNSIKSLNIIKATMVVFTYICSQYYDDSETFYRMKMHQILAEKFESKGFKILQPQQPVLNWSGDHLQPHRSQDRRWSPMQTLATVLHLKTSKDHQRSHQKLKTGRRRSYDLGDQSPPNGRKVVANAV